jgi:hypothetical protein
MMSGFALSRKSTHYFMSGNEFDQKTTQLTAAGCAHCLAIARPKPIGNTWRHFMAGDLHVYLELLSCTNWN